MKRRLSIMVVCMVAAPLVLLGCSKEGSGKKPASKEGTTKKGATTKKSPAGKTGETATSTSAKPKTAKKSSTSPQTLEKLITTALAAIKKGDSPSFVALAPTVEEWRKTCPAEVKRAGGFAGATKLLQEFAKEAAAEVSGRCMQLELKNAKRISITRGPVKQLKQCPGTSFMTRIDAHYALRDSYLRVRLRGVYNPEGSRARIMQAPKCRLEKGPAPIPWAEAKLKALPATKAWVAAVCKCKDTACLDAQMERMSTLSNLMAPHRDRFMRDKALNKSIMQTLKQQGQCVAKIKAAKPAKK